MREEESNPANISELKIAQIFEVQQNQKSYLVKFRYNFDIRKPKIMKNYQFI